MPSYKLPSPEERSALYELLSYFSVSPPPARSTCDSETGQRRSPVMLHRRNIVAAGKPFGPHLANAGKVVMPIEEAKRRPLRPPLRKA